MHDPGTGHHLEVQNVVDDFHLMNLHCGESPVEERNLGEVGPTGKDKMGKNPLGWFILSVNWTDRDAAGLGLWKDIA